MSNQDSYNVQRVHRVNIAVTVFIVLLLTVQAMFTGGIEKGISIGLQGFTVIVLSVINYFLPINKYTKDLLFAAIPAVVMIALMYLGNYSLNKHYIILTTVS